MFSVNKATILGNLTRDPELRYTPNGQAVCNFGVATNRRYKNSSTGEVVEDTQFHDIVAWGKLAEIINQIFKKGSKIYLEGRLQTRSWDAPDGSKRYRTEIIMENFVPLTPKGMTGDMPDEFSDNTAANSAPTSTSDTTETQTATKPNTKSSDKKTSDAKKKTSKTSNNNTKKSSPADTDNEEDFDLDDIPF